MKKLTLLILLLLSLPCAANDLVDKLHNQSKIVAEVDAYCNAKPEIPFDKCFIVVYNRMMYYSPTAKTNKY